MANTKKPKVKNPAVVAAIEAYRQQRTPQNEKALLDAIKEATFVAPISLTASPEDVEPDENGNRQMQASLKVVATEDGTKYFPAFTDWLEFLKWANDPDADTAVISFDQYCDILLRNHTELRGVLINPAENSFLLLREKMAEMKGIELPKEQQAASSITPLFGVEKVANPELLQAVNALMELNSDENRNEVVACMRKSRFVAPVLMDLPKEVKPGDKVTAKAEFIMINREGRKYIPLFTSLSELRKWNGVPSCKAVPMVLSNYSAIMADPKNSAVGIVLDPLSFGLAFSKEQVLSIQPQMQLRKINSAPNGMKEELRDHYEEMPAVKQAYLNGAKVNGMDGYAVVLDMEPDADIREVADQTAKWMKKYGPCIVSPTNSPIGQQTIKDVKPFYTKG